jgi:molybdate/tungstate transport system substrate-binding protein
MQRTTPEAPSLLGRLTIRHAGSLTRLCAEINREFHRLYPEVEIIDVGGGGVQMAREVAAGKECDIYASVDYSNIPNLMMPDLADWYVVFASTGFVLRYTDKSKYANQVNATNWFEILQRDDVAFWRSDPEGDPAGYRTLMVLQLAEQYYGVPGLCQRLAEKSEKQFLSVHFLEERDTGYAFSYSSHLMGGKSVRLPDAINLSSDAFEGNYRKASVTIQSLKPGITVDIKGERIRIGLTILKNSTNRGAATAWVQLILSEVGAAMIREAGKCPLNPTFEGDLTKLPFIPGKHSK